jgi:hypothetical protein
MKIACIEGIVLSNEKLILIFLAFHILYLRAVFF